MDSLKLPKERLKFLCLYKPCGEYYRYLGFKNALESLGHSWVWLQPEQRPIHDVFSEYEPDVFIGTTYDLCRATMDAIKKRPHLKVILKGGNFGINDDKVDRKKYPIVFISENEKILLDKFKKETGKPDYVTCHYNLADLEPNMGLWRNLGIEPIAIQNAADTTIYNMNKTKVDPILKSDVVFIGGYWPYKSIELNKYIIPLSKIKGINLKVFGSNWPIPQFLGNISDTKVANAYRSSLIAPNVSEPHSITSNGLGAYDVVERPFKAITSGAEIVMMDDVKSAKDNIWGDSLPYYDSPTVFLDMINEFMKYPEKRPDMTKAREITFKNHTYFNRVQELLKKLYE